MLRWMADTPRNKGRVEVTFDKTRSAAITASLLITLTEPYLIQATSAAVFVPEIE